MQWIDCVPLFAFLLPSFMLFFTFVPRRTQYRKIYSGCLFFCLCSTLCIWGYLFTVIYGTETFVYEFGGRFVKALSVDSIYSTPTVLYFDSFTVLSGLLISLLGCIIPLLMFQAFFISRKNLSFSGSYCLLLSSSLGMIMTSDLFNYYFCMQIAALALYFIMMGVSKRCLALRRIALRCFFSLNIALIFMLIGIAMLYARYNLTSMPGLAEILEYGLHEKIVFSLILFPLLFFLAMPPLHLWYKDVVNSGCTICKYSVLLLTLASCLGLLRISFSLFGGIFNSGVFSSVFVVLAACALLCLFRNSLCIRNIDQIILNISLSQVSCVLLAASTGSLALKSSFAVAQYGFLALQGGIFMLIYYPFVIAIVYALPGVARSFYHISDKWHLGLFGVFFAMLLVLVGIPPFAGYTARLMIAQSVFVLNPLLALLVILLSILQLVALIYFFFRSAGEEVTEDLNKTAMKRLKHPVSLCVIACVVVYLAGVSLFPYPVVTEGIAPAIESLINKGDYSVPVIEEGNVQ